LPKTPIASLTTLTVSPDRKVPRLPTFPARWALEDPRRRSYFVFWTDRGGNLVRALLMAPTDDGRVVLGPWSPSGADRSQDLATCLRARLAAAHRQPLPRI